jgi:hypothetical protein
MEAKPIPYYEAFDNDCLLLSDKYKDYLSSFNFNGDNTVRCFFWISEHPPGLILFDFPKLEGEIVNELKQIFAKHYLVME